MADKRSPRKADKRRARLAKQRRDVARRRGDNQRENPEHYGYHGKPKKVYLSEDAAKLAAEERERLYKVPFNYYRCGTCGLFHVGQRNEKAVS